MTATPVCEHPAVAHVITQGLAMTPSQAERLNRAAQDDTRSASRMAAYESALHELLVGASLSSLDALRRRMERAIPISTTAGACWALAVDAVQATAACHHLTAETWAALTAHWERVMGPIPCRRGAH